MKYLQQDIDITHLSNFKTPAKAEYYFEVHKDEDLENLIEVVRF
jgi:hypothetical protein